MSIHWGGRGPGHMSRWPKAAQWWEGGALLDADYTAGRYYFNGRTYSSVAALATAMGGTNSGNVLTVGPYLTGNMLYQSDFSAGIDSFAETSNPDNGSLANSSGNLVGTVTTSTYRYSRAVSANRKAAKITATQVSTTQASRSLAIGNNSGLSGAATVATAMTANGDYSAIGCTDGSTIYAGLQTSGAGQTTTTNWRMEEVLPFAGFIQGQHRFEFDFTTGTIGTQQVIAHLGIPSASAQSNRLLIDTSGNLRLIVTVSNSTVLVNLDLGVLSPATRYKVRGSLADNAFYANLDGGPWASDLSGIAAPAALFWLGRSQAGETFTGTIHHAKVWPTAVSDPNMLVDPARALFIAGDSTGAGTGATAKWFDNFGSPVRAYNNGAVGGETSTQMLARVQAAAAFYHDWPLIIMDRPNTGEDAALWLANMKAAGAVWGDKWFIMPPAQDVPDTSIANIATVQAALLSDPDFAGHTLGAVEQAAYLTAVADAGTRSDGLHFDDDGQAIQQTYADDFITAASW